MVKTAEDTRTRRQKRGVATLPPKKAAKAKKAAKKRKR